jgi:hypothetical protein
MTKIFCIVIAFGLTGCFGKSEKDIKNSQPTVKSIIEGEYIWTKLLDSADWKKSYNFQMFSIKDTLWIFHFDGNWYSADGKEWRKSSLPNAVGNVTFLNYIQFKDAVYGLGHFEGNVEKFSLESSIYRTTDLQQWDTISKSSNLPKRFFYHPFIFDNKIWIIGGEDKNMQYSDIWNSADGITWRKQKDNLPFGKRSRSQIVQLNKKLFLLDNDVWSSKDGLNWQKETNEILKGENIFGYAAVVFDSKIWLIGCNRNGKFSSQVLVSTDGKIWHTERAPWTPRGGIAATAHGGKIYMTGGKYGGTPDRPEFIYSNDVWTLEKRTNYR